MKPDIVKMDVSNLAGTSGSFLFCFVFFSSSNCHSRDQSPPVASHPKRKSQFLKLLTSTYEMGLSSPVLRPAAPPSPAHTGSLLFLDHIMRSPLRDFALVHPSAQKVPPSHIHSGILPQFPQNSRFKYYLITEVFIERPLYGIGSCPDTSHFLFSLPCIIFCLSTRHHLIAYIFMCLLSVSSPQNINYMRERDWFCEMLYLQCIPGSSTDAVNICWKS